MDKHRFRENARLYYLPVVLGEGREARRLCRLIFRRCGVVSLHLSAADSFADIFALSYRRVSLVETEHDSLLCHQLTELCERYPYTLPILIPVGETRCRSVERLRDRLEPYFIISDPASVLCDSPLTAMVR